MTSVLIVDDLASNRYLMRLLLEQRGYSVEEAATGNEALAHARRHRPDAVVSDLLMPEMDGFTLCREWNSDATLRQIPFIVYTATFTDAKDRELARDLGASAFIVKPAEPDTVVDAIGEAIESAGVRGETPAPPSSAQVVRRYAERLKAKLDDRLTKLERSERGLAEHLAQHQLVLDSLPSAVFTIDSGRAISDWNLAAEALVDPESLQGRPLLDLVTEDTRPGVERLFDTDTRYDVPTECEFVGLDGRPVPVAVTVAPLGKTRGFVLVARDRTREVRAAEESRRLNHQVAQIDRLASLGLLAAGVAHEINNPLTHLLFNLESIVRDIPSLADPSSSVDAPSMVKVAVETLQSARRIRDISRGLNSFSRVEDEATEPVDLRTAIESACTLAQNKLRNRARLHRSFETDAKVRGTEGRLSQVFLNLLLNAADALSDGSASENEIKIRTWREGSLVYATVRDNGRGVSDELREHIFEPLVSTKRYGEGSGLGLAISKNIVERYGGRISVQSELGQFSEFQVVLPVEDAVPAVPSHAPEASGQLRVLVVDDEPALRRVLVLLLDAFEVREAASVTQAKQLIAQDPGFDVILCDLMMPEHLGTELHRWLAETQPVLADRVVFLSGAVTSGDVASYLASVPNPILAKPMNNQALLDVIKRVAGES
jgi:PAS domain S-box-containing protein